MLSSERYQRHTGDTSQDDDDVDDAIALAVEMLEEVLGRPLAEDERTERLFPDVRGRMWPRATPIATAAGYVIDGLAIRSSGPFVNLGPPFSTVDYLTVTYTGGWVAHPAADDEDPIPVNVLPLSIERDLAFAAYRLLHPAPLMTQLPVNAGSATVGDVSVAGAGGKALRPPSDTTGWWSRRTLAYRYAPLSTVPA